MRRTLIYVLTTMIMTTPVYAGTLQEAGSGYMYLLENGTYASNAWEWIDRDGDGLEECCHFNNEGVMDVNTVIDGYTVNDNGIWTINGIKQSREPSMKATEDEYNLPYVTFHPDGWRFDKGMLGKDEQDILSEWLTTLSINIDEHGLRAIDHINHVINERGDGVACIRVDINKFDDMLDDYDYIKCEGKEIGFYEQNTSDEYFGNDAIKNEVWRIINEAGITEGMNKMEAIQRLAGWFEANVSYDNARAQTPLHDSIPLRSGVCYHYAKFYNYACNCLGIKNTFECGLLDGSLHIWNRVVLNGKSYYSDMTCVVSAKDRAKYLLSDTLWNGFEKQDLGAKYLLSN